MTSLKILLLKRYDLWSNLRWAHMKKVGLRDQCFNHTLTNCQRTDHMHVTSSKCSPQSKFKIWDFGLKICKLHSRTQRFMKLHPPKNCHGTPIFILKKHKVIENLLTCLKMWCKIFFCTVYRRNCTWTRLVFLIFEKGGVSHLNYSPATILDKGSSPLKMDKA